MSATTHDAALEATDNAPRRRPLARLGSALAIVPLGVWTLMHLWDNLYAWRGAEAWQSRVTVARHPAVEITTSTIVLLPLILHTLWGLRRIGMSKPNLGRYPTFDNLKYLLQRLSALGLLAFLGAHIYLARLRPAMTSPTGHEPFAALAHEMRFHMPTLVVYVLGVLGLAYHLGNGIGTAAMTWGVAASRKSQSRMNGVSMASFVILLAMGWGAVAALWTKGGEAHANAPSAEHSTTDSSTTESPRGESH